MYHLLSTLHMIHPEHRRLHTESSIIPHLRAYKEIIFKSISHFTVALALMSTRCNGACQKWVAREDNFEGGLMKRESKSVKKNSLSIINMLGTEVIEVLQYSLRINFYCRNQVKCKTESTRWESYRVSNH